MPKLRIHCENYDEMLGKARRLKLEIGNKRIETPSRTLNLGNNVSEARLIENKNIRGINEIYKKLTAEKMEQIDIDTKSEIAFGNKLKNTLNKSDLENELNLLLFSYENKNIGLGNEHNILPTRQEVEFICDVISHPHSDVIIPPRMQGLSGNLYLQFLQLFFDTLLTRSYDKPLIGFLPFVARIDLPAIVDFYIKKGIFSFIVDFQGNNPIDIYTHVELIHNLVRNIKREYNEEVYLHAFNVPFTRVKHRIDATPAKDIITFLLGFDSFGSNHLPQRLPLEVVQKIRERQGRRFVSWSNQIPDPSYLNSANQPETFRIFNRNDYGYYRSDLQNIRELISSENSASISLEEIYMEEKNEDRLKSIRKAFNVERHGLEAAELRRAISENSIMKYLQNKKYVKEKWNIIEKANIV